MTLFLKKIPGGGYPRTPYKGSGASRPRLGALRPKGFSSRIKFVPPPLEKSWVRACVKVLPNSE